MKELKAKKNDELEWLHNRLWFGIIKHRFWRIGNIEGEIELRKIRKVTEKKNNIKRLKAEIKDIKEIQIEVIEYISLELLDDLNKKRKLIIEGIIKSEAKLDKLKIPKGVNDIIRKSIS